MIFFKNNYFLNEIKFILDKQKKFYLEYMTWINKQLLMFMIFYLLNISVISKYKLPVKYKFY